MEIKWQIHDRTLTSPLPLFGDRSLRKSSADRTMSEDDYGECNMADQEQAEIRLMVARLRQEHEDYDAAINAMIADRLRCAAHPAHEEEEAGRSRTR